MSMKLTNQPYINILWIYTELFSCKCGGQVCHLKFV